MIRLLRDLLKTLCKEHTSGQVKVHRSKFDKLLIYDEYLKKYVSADELLIPGVKEIKKGTSRNSKLKGVFFFDVLLKKFVNPKLDLLIPGIQPLDLIINNNTNNKKENLRTSSTNFFWGKKSGKKHSVTSLPPVHDETIIDTEQPQVGWAGQKTRKPLSDPRPEVGKVKCSHGPGNDNNKKKPPKKKKKKNIFLVCGKVKNVDTNTKDKSNHEQMEKNAIQEIKYNEENCYADLKDKKLDSQLPNKYISNSVSQKALKSVSKLKIKGEIFLDTLIKESTKNENCNTLKSLCKKLFSNVDKVKIDKRKCLKKSSVCDLKDQTSSNIQTKCDSSKEKNNLIKNKTNLKTNKSKALLCKQMCQKNLDTNESMKSFLCKEKTSKSKNENSNSKNTCLPSTAGCEFNNLFKDERQVTNIEMQYDKLMPCFYKNKMKNMSESNRKNQNNICLNKENEEEYCKINSDKHAKIEELKFECNKLNTKRPNTSAREPLLSSINKEDSNHNAVQSDINKPKDSAYNFMVKPKTSNLKKPCVKDSFMLSTPSTKKCNSRNKSQQKIKTCDNNDELVCKGSNTEKSKIDNNYNKTCLLEEKPVSKTNVDCWKSSKKVSKDSEIHKTKECSTSKTFNIDTKSTEKLQCIAQEQFFEKADLSPDLSKCSSYMGFKVKKPCSETKTTKDKKAKNQSKVTETIEDNCKADIKSNTVLRTSRSNETCFKSEKNDQHLKMSKSEECLNKKQQKKTLKKSSKSPSELNLKPKKPSKLDKEKKDKSPCQKDSHDIKSSKISKQSGDLGNELVKERMSDKRKNAGTCCNKFTDPVTQEQSDKKCNNKLLKKECVKSSKDGSDITNVESKNQSLTAKKETKETKETKKKKNKSMDDLKHIITGATQSKKLKLSKKKKLFKSTKSQVSLKKIEQNKSSPEICKKDQPSEKPKRSKSAIICSEKKLNTNEANHIKKSKSNHEMVSKAKSERKSSTTEKSVKAKNSNKLNKLAHKAKCNTAQGNSTKQTVNHAIICSKSTPNIKPTNKDKKTVEILNSKDTIKKCPSSSNINNSSNKLKESKKSFQEVKQTKMCSLHTWPTQKNEISIKNSKKELKLLDKPKTTEKVDSTINMSPLYEVKSKCCRSNVQLKELKTGSSNNSRVNTVLKSLKETISTEDFKPKTKTKNFSLTTFEDKKLLRLKNRHSLPSLNNGKFNQQPISFTREKVLSDNKEKNLFKLGKLGLEPINSSNIIKDQDKILFNKTIININKAENSYKNKLVTCDIVNEYRKNCGSLAAKNEKINRSFIGKAPQTGQNSKPKTRDKHMTNKIKDTLCNNLNHNEQLKETKFVLNKNTNSLTKEITNKNGTNKSFIKVKNIAYEPVLEKDKTIKLSAIDFSGSKNTNSLNQTLNASCGTQIESCKHTLNGQQKNLSFCPIKNSSSLSPLNTHMKHSVKHSQSQNSELNKKNKFMSSDTNINSNNNQGKCNQDQKPNNIVTVLSPQDKIVDNSHLQKTKHNPLKHSSKAKVTDILVENDRYRDIKKYKKQQNSSLSKQKSALKKPNSAQTVMSNKNCVKNENILCDFIEGSLDVDIKGSRFPKESQNIPNPYLGMEKSETKDNKTAIIFSKVKTNPKCNNQNGMKSRKTTFTNRLLLIDELEKHVSKIENIVPSMKRILRPMFLTGDASVEEKKELNKSFLAINTPYKRTKLEKNTSINGTLADDKFIKKNIYINETKQSFVNDNEKLKPMINGIGNGVESNVPKNLQETTINKCLDNTFKTSFENNVSKSNTLTSQVGLINNKNILVNKSSPKLKSKIRLIKKRYGQKNNALTTTKQIISKDITKSEEKHLQKKVLDSSQDNNNTIHHNGTDYVVITASLSAKQSRSLMKQPFIKKPKSVPVPSVSLDAQDLS